jgi:hypothetical protein
MKDELPFYHIDSYPTPKAGLFTGEPPGAKRL